MSSTKTATSTTVPSEFLQVNGQSYPYRRFGNGPGLPCFFFSISQGRSTTGIPNTEDRGLTLLILYSN